LCLVALCCLRQFCLHIAFNVAALGDDVYVLDTCNTFLAKRGSGMLLKPTPPRPSSNNNEGAGAAVAAGGGVGVVSAETKLLCEEALTRVHVAQVFDVFELLTQLDQIYQLCSNISSLASSSGGGGSGGSGGVSGRRLPRLLVIDSLGALLSPIMSSDKRSQVLISTVQRAIKALATTFNIAVLVSSAKLASTSLCWGFVWPGTNLDVFCFVCLFTACAHRRRTTWSAQATIRHTTNSSLPWVRHRNRHWERTQHHDCDRPGSDKQMLCLPFSFLCALFFQVFPGITSRTRVCNSAPTSPSWTASEPR